VLAEPHDRAAIQTRAALLATTTITTIMKNFTMPFALEVLNLWKWKGRGEGFFFFHHLSQKQRT
jgi:hypothetical protein